MWVNSTYNIRRMYYRMKREECICPYDEVITDIDLVTVYLFPTVIATEYQAESLKFEW